MAETCRLIALGMFAAMLAAFASSAAIASAETTDVITPVEIKDTPVKTDYVTLVGSRAGLSEAYTEYRLCNVDASAIDAKAATSARADYNVVKGSLREIWTEKQVNETYTETITNYDRVCTPARTDVNGTKTETCIIKPTTTTATKWRIVWARFDPADMKYDTGRCYNIRVHARYDIPFMRPVSIDNVVSFAGYSYDEYDWWNVSFPYRYPIFSNGTNATNMVFPANNTFGVAGWTMFFRNASAGETIYLYCSDVPCSGARALGNATHQKYFEYENMTGNSPALAYDSTYKSVYHLYNTSVNDTLGTYNSWAKVGTPTSNTGILGNGVNFTGGSFIASGTYYPSVSTSAFTVAYWANITGVNSAVDRILFGLQKNNGIIHRWPGTGGTTEFYFNNANAVTFAATTGVMHIAARWNGTHGTVWVNGTLMGTVASAANAAAGGSDQIGTNLQGSMDEIYIWNRSLGDQEIREQFLAGATQHNMTALGPMESYIMDVNLPGNSTYPTAHINGTTVLVSDITYSIDGAANQSICSGCSAFDTTATASDGPHRLDVYGLETAAPTNKYNASVYFTLDLTPPLVVALAPTGSYVSNTTALSVTYGVSDRWSSVSTCWWSDSGGANTTIGACANTTMTPTLAGLRNISIYANDTFGRENVSTTSFTYDPFQNFTANNSIGGAKIDNFQLLIMETSGSYSTANGTIPVPISAIGYGSRTLRFISTGYNTTDFTHAFDAGSLHKYPEDNYTLVPASLNISVFDEGQAALGIWTNITFNITLANSTMATTWYNQSSFFKYANETPTGSITADISSTGYVARRYYFNANSNAANKFTAYLLQSADALLVRFHVQNAAGGSIAGASVNASRFIGSAWSLVAQQTSDESGTAALYLYPFATYTIAAGASGYISTSVSIQPSATDYMLTLQSASASLPYQTSTTNVTMLFLPSATSLNASINTFTCRAISTDNSLLYVSFNLTAGNGTLIYANNTATLAGLTINYTHDFIHQNGTNATALCAFRRSGYSEVRATRMYFIYNVTGGGAEQGLGAAASYYSKMALGLVSIIVTMLAAGVASKMGNAVAGAFTGLVVLGIFTFYLGWFDWLAYTLICATFVAILYLRSGV